MKNNKRFWQFWTITIILILGLTAQAIMIYRLEKFKEEAVFISYSATERIKGRYYVTTKTHISKKDTWKNENFYESMYSR